MKSSMILMQPTKKLHIEYFGLEHYERYTEFFFKEKYLYICLHREIKTFTRPDPKELTVWETKVYNIAFLKQVLTEKYQYL